MANIKVRVFGKKRVKHQSLLQVKKLMYSALMAHQYMVINIFLTILGKYLKFSTSLASDKILVIKNFE